MPLFQSTSRIASPALTGDPTAPTATAGDADTSVATTEFVTAAVAAETLRATTAEALLAPTASPALTGDPTAPTQAPGDADTSIATTGFVAAAVAPLAPTASPTFTGTPAAPTAAADTSTTQLATTAYVVGQASAASPVVDGIAAVGASTRYARADHVHPTDTSRAPAVEAVNVVGASGASQILPDPSVSSVSDVTLTASCEFTMPAVAAAGTSVSCMVVLEQGGTGSYTPTFTGATWPSGTAPSWSTAVGAIDQVMFSSTNGRAWVGAALIGVAAP
jgi:hypothetical protein